MDCPRLSNTTLQEPASRGRIDHFKVLNKAGIAETPVGRVATSGLAGTMAHASACDGMDIRHTRTPPAPGCRVVRLGAGYCTTFQGLHWPALVQESAPPKHRPIFLGNMI